MRYRALWRTAGMRVPRSIRAFVKGLEPEQYVSIDFDSFLRATASLRLSRGERLRRLAIALEGEADPLANHVAAFNRIYERAALARPQDPLIYDSWGLTLMKCGDDTWWEYAMHKNTLPPMSADEAHARKGRLYAEARRKIARAIELAPDDPRFHYTMGQAIYEDSGPSAPSLDDALAYFRRAATLDHDDMLGQMPQLYVGHCTFDLEHWADALEAFRRVDTRILHLAWPAWRALKRRELEAECFRRLGLHSEAVAVFRTLMEEARSEAKRDSNFFDVHEVDYLIKAAAGELAAELCEEAWGFLFEVGVFKVDAPDDP